MITEAPIDALSIAAIDGEPPGTIYVATGGGMGPGTIAAIEAMLTTIAIVPNAVLLSAWCSPHPRPTARVAAPRVWRRCWLPPLRVRA